MRSVILVCLVTGAAGAASLADVIGVPVQTRYQVGTLGAASGGLLQGEVALERTDALQKMSTISMVVTEKALAEEEAMQGLLVHGKRHVKEANLANIEEDLKKEGMEGVVSTLERTNQKALSKALLNVMKFKQEKAIDHMTLEETLAKQEQQKQVLAESGKKFGELFETVKTRHENCQQCLKDCPAREFEKYNVLGEKECMKNCELVICQEVWNRLAGSYRQQLTEFNNRPQGIILNAEYAKPNTFTNYLGDYLKNKGEKAMYYEDEDTETEIVWDKPTSEQLKADEEHDAKLDRFLFVFNREHKKAPIRSFGFRRMGTQASSGNVQAMEPAEDELSTRLSRTALEAEIIAKSTAFGVPAEWIPGFEQE